MSFPRPRLLPLLTVLTLSFAGPLASTASADEPLIPGEGITRITLSEPTPNTRLPAEVDLLKAVVEHDRARGIIAAQVTLGADPTQVSEPTWVHVSLGFPLYGRCNTNVGLSGVAHVLGRSDSASGFYGLSAPTDQSGVAEKSYTSPTTVLFRTPADARMTTKYVCVRVRTLADAGGKADDSAMFDSMIGMLPDEPLAPTGPVAPAPVGNANPVLDSDKDAVPDVNDKCPTQPGAGSDGCPTVSADKALRLGTKRLVIDQLLERTGKACPPAVKVTVAAKGRTLAKKRIGTLAKGSYCHVTATLKLKKRATKVRVVVAGEGIGAVRAVVKKG